MPLEDRRKFNWPARRLPSPPPLPRLIYSRIYGNVSGDSVAVSLSPLEAVF